MHRDAADRIISAIKKKDRKSAQQLAHSLKGTAANLSAKHLHLAARELEAAIKENLEDKISILMEDVDEALRAVMESTERLNRIMEKAL